MRTRPNLKTMINNSDYTQTQPLHWNQAMSILYSLKGKGELKNLVLFSLGFFTACRVSDLRSLTWEQIQQQELILTEKKTGKRRVIYFDPLFCEFRDWVISQYLESPKGYIFRYERKGAANTPITVQAINKRVKAVLNNFNVAGKKSSHVLRKTFARRIYMTDPSEHKLVLLSKILNHSSTSTTKLYIGLTQDNIKEAYLNLSSPNRKYKKAS